MSLPTVPRILFCSDTYPPQVNGVSVVTAASVAGIQVRGWDCAVVNPRYPKPYGEAFASDATSLGAVRIHEKLPSVPFPPYPDIRLAAPLYRRVRDLARAFQPQIIHAQTEFLIGWMAQRAARELGIPLVSSYHTDFSRYTESYGVPWLRPVVARHIQRFHRRAARVFTPSEPAKRDLVALGVAGDRVEVWGRGVDVGAFHPAKRSARLRRDLGLGDGFLFLHVGRMAAEKNVPVLLEGFREFRASHPRLRAHLVVAGAGPALDPMRRRAPEGVVFLGNLDRQGVLPALYASCDAFVYASETETLGLVVLEAMASGLPVIATPAGGVADNLRHMYNGLAYPARDIGALAAAMSVVATDAQLRRKLSRDARAWSETRSWDAELDRLEASYREVVAASSGPERVTRS